MSENLTKSIYEDSVNQQSNIFYKKYCKYKKKYLQLKKIGGSNGIQRFGKRINNELMELQDNNEFISVSPYEFNFRNLIIKLNDEYPFKIILENKITEENIDSTNIWSPQHKSLYFFIKKKNNENP